MLFLVAREWREGSLRVGLLVTYLGEDSKWTDGNETEKCSTTRGQSWGPIWKERGQRAPVRQERRKQREPVGEDRSSPSGQGVLDGVGERMAQVQGSCHVGGWDAHHEDAPRIWCWHARTLWGKEDRHQLRPQVTSPSPLVGNVFFTPSLPISSPPGLGGRAHSLHTLAWRSPAAPTKGTRLPPHTEGYRSQAWCHWHLGERKGGVSVEAGSSWEGDDGPAEKDLGLCCSYHRTGIGRLCRSL